LYTAESDVGAGTVSNAICSELNGCHAYTPVAAPAVPEGAKVPTNASKPAPLGPPDTDKVTVPCGTEPPPDTPSTHTDTPTKLPYTNDDSDNDTRTLGVAGVRSYAPGTELDTAIT
jgi:hypothetical protein